MLKGIDISKWQNGINLEALDCDFIILKATEGVGYVDNTCDGFYQKAKALGKKLGVYHFARPDLGNSAISEADYFLNNIKGYIKESILILDWEPNGNSIGNVSWAKQWLDRVYEKTGVKPVIYMSASPSNSYDWSSVSAGDYGLWVASYGANNGIAGNKPTCKYWPFYCMWQYTSVGKLNGYNGNLDLNYFYGDSQAWDKYAGGSPVKTSSFTKSNDEIANEVIAGSWGNGDDRKNKLASAGYNYDIIQAIVNNKLGVSTKQNYQTYIVKRGDTLSSIASRYNTTYQKIASDNGIANPNKIYPGQVLKIY